MALTYDLPWERQPQPGVPAAPRWLARGLRVLTLGGGRHNYAASAEMGAAGTAGNVATKVRRPGHVLEWSGGTTPQYRLTWPMDTAAAQPLTSLHVVTITSLATSVPLLYTRDTSIGGFLHRLNATGLPTLVKPGTAEYGNDGFPAAVVGDTITTLLRIDVGRNYTFWRGGRKSATATGPSFDVGTLISIGADNDAATQLRGDKAIALSALFDGALTDAECAEISENPWRLFAPRVMPFPLEVAAAGSAIGTAAGAATTSALAGSSTAAASLSAAAGVATASALAGTSTAVAAITAADGVATASALAASSTAATAITAAAGAATTSALAGTSTAVAAFGVAAGVATGETLVGVAGTGSAITAAAGVATASALAGTSTAAAALGVAAGAASAQALAASSTAAAAFGVAAGAATAATLVGGTGITAANIVSATGTASPQIIVGAAFAAAAIGAAAGVATAATLSPASLANSAPPLGHGPAMSRRAGITAGRRAGITTRTR